MIRDFDVTSDGKRLLYTDMGVYGDLSTRLFDCLTKRNALVVDDSWNPCGPRMFHDGKAFVFYGYSKILMHDLVANETNVVFAEEGLSPGFCEPSHDGKSIVFSAYSPTTPPSIFACFLQDLTIEKETDDLAADRFPHWSPSDTYIAHTRQYLSDLHKRRWVGIYCRDTDKHIVVPKDKDASCFLNKHCWSPSRDVLVYLEQTDNKGIVKLYSPATTKADFVCHTTDVREVSFWTESELLLISEDKLESYSLEKGKVTMSVEVPSGGKLHSRADGAVIRVSGNAVYFLTDFGTIFRFEHNDAVEVILESRQEEYPDFEKSEVTIRSFDGKRIPIYHYLPAVSNGYACIFLIGGPGGAAGSDDRVITRFLSEGYELIVPAYRGCQENPDNRGTMGFGDVRDVIETGRYFKAKFGFPLPIVGYSYGGLLAGLASAASDDVFSCSVTLWGVTALETMSLHLHNALTEDMSAEEQQRILRERSVVEQSKKITQPVLILHGDRDTTATPEVRQIRDHIRANGAQCELVVYQNDGHGLRRNTDDYHSRILRFLNLFAQHDDGPHGTSHNAA